jgi:hypothetical protein
MKFQCHSTLLSLAALVLRQMKSSSIFCRDIRLKNLVTQVGHLLRLTLSMSIHVYLTQMYLFYIVALTCKLVAYRRPRNKRDNSHYYATARKHVPKTMVTNVKREAECCLRGPRRRVKKKRINVTSSDPVPGGITGPPCSWGI